MVLQLFPYPLGHKIPKVDMVPRLVSGFIPGPSSERDLQRCPRAQIFDAVLGNGKDDVIVDPLSQLRSAMLIAILSGITAIFTACCLHLLHSEGLVRRRWLTAPKSFYCS